MEKLPIKALPRKEKGKEKAKKARARGLIPAVLYGKGLKESKLLYVEHKEFTTKVYRSDIKGMILELDVDGKKHNAILKEIQFHPVTYEPLHIDFQAIRMDQPVEVTVAVKLVGEPVGVKKGGVLEFETRELDIKALPHAIPEAIEVDISGLEVGYFIKVKDITPPEGVEILEDPETVIALVAAERMEEELAAAEVEEEGEEPEVIGKKKEGEEGEGEGKEEEKKEAEEK